LGITFNFFLLCCIHIGSSVGAFKAISDCTTPLQKTSLQQSTFSFSLLTTEEFKNTMPSRKFPLDNGELEIAWKGLWRDVVVSVDGAQIGTVATQKEMKQGRTFTLSNGAVLEIKLEQNGDDFTLRVSKDGKPLSSRQRGGVVGQVLAVVLLLLALVGLGAGAMTEAGMLDLMPEQVGEGFLFIGAGGVALILAVALMILMIRRARQV
jgi:hypothetical protein